MNKEECYEDLFISLAYVSFSDIKKDIRYRNAKTTQTQIDKKRKEWKTKDFYL